METFKVVVEIRNERTGELRKESHYIEANHWEESRVKAYDKVRSNIEGYELIMQVYVEEGESPWN